MSEVTLKQVVQTTREIVDEFGAGHVAECYYVRDEQPMCIAGVIMYRTGLATLEELKKMEGAPFFNTWVYDKVEHETARFIDNLQREQDAGRSWGQAWSVATKSLPVIDED